MSTRRKTVLLIIIIAIACAAATGFYFYNKPPVNIKTAAAPTVESQALYEAFSKDAVMAPKEYAGHVLLVKGVVADVSQNSQGNTVVLLQAGMNDGHINCTFEKNISGLQAGAPISIKGFCSGMGETDTMLGIPADVYLERCIIP
ncbi:MAG: hypothetical protein QM687_03335 [Ferruginibacter sp.]